MNRLASYNNASVRRLNYAEGIYRRYRNNIQRSLGYSNVGRGFGVLDIANQRFSNPRYQSIREINNVRVSRNVYMGLYQG